MTRFDLQQHVHRRFNPLTGDWVLVSPRRLERPWQGQTETLHVESAPRYDPECYMCPGNLRAGGIRNPAYEGVFVFENDYPALVPGTPESSYKRGNLMVAQSESGVCRVLCFSPRHDLTISRMDVGDIRRIVDAWAEQFADLAALPSVKSVQIFENRGAMMGASNPHPHCQIWANATVPDVSRKEQASFADYHREHGACLLCNYLRAELESGERLVCENDAFVALVPFWAVWPFETLLLSKNHVADIPTLSGEECSALAAILKRLTTRYDNLFQTSFPYSMGFHLPPADGDHPEWHFHAHFFPPLLRSATVKKFLVGYELLAWPQRDITAENAAEKLRGLPETHYLERS